MSLLLVYAEVLHFTRQDMPLILDLLNYNMQRFLCLFLLNLHEMRAWPNWAGKLNTMAGDWLCTTWFVRKDCQWQDSYGRYRQAKELLPHGPAWKLPLVSLTMVSEDNTLFYDGMRARTKLTCLHHNHNVGRQQAHTAAGPPCYKLVFPKAQGEWVVKKKGYKKTDDMAILIALLHDVHDAKIS